MKPAKFIHERPATVQQAVALLGRYEEAKVLAGGQSLVPLLSMRLSQPEALIDLAGIAGMDGIEVGADAVTIGAMATHRRVETDPEVGRRIPLLPMALANVGHVTIRNQGTIGGSIAHADPAAELPAVALALEATMVVTGPAGTREIAAADFFEGFLTTALGADEILTAVRFPLPPAGTRWAVEEFARRHGDFALVAVYAGLRISASGTIDWARLALGGVAATPVRAAAVETELLGRPATPQLLAAAARAAAESIDPPADIHGTTAFRKDLAATLTERALRRIADVKDGAP